MSWGQFTLEAEGAGRVHEIGPTTLWLSRAGREWQLAFEGEGDAQSAVLSCTDSSAAPPGLSEPERYLADEGVTYTLTPVLADRSVVVRPEARLHVLPGCDVPLYVSTPVWWRFTIGERVAVERPVSRPSDTWFGPSLREGQLCYASRTRALLSFRGVPPRPARAVTRVLLQNRRETPLEVERLALPVRELDLAVAADGHIWTDAVRVTVGADGEASMVIEATPPDEAGPLSSAIPAREPSPRFQMFRALSALLQ